MKKFVLILLILFSASNIRSNPCNQLRNGARLLCNKTFLCCVYVCRKLDAGFMVLRGEKKDDIVEEAWNSLCQRLK